MDVLVLIGRVLFALLFLGAGMGPFSQREMMTGYAASKGVPAARLMVPLSGAVIILGGLMVAVGVWPDLGALLLIAFLVPTALLMHAFWRETDPASKANEQTQFLKDLSLAGAALALFALLRLLGRRARPARPRPGVHAVTGSLSDLTARSGARPRTTPSNPHTQLDQQPVDERPRRLLEKRLVALPGVVWRPSMISVPGPRALTLPPEAAQGPPEAFMVGTEFALLHPRPDHSLHLVLPPDVASGVIEAGWAEQHPVARRGLITSGAVMVYAPRDEEEAELVSQIVTAAFEYATNAPA